MPRFLCGNRRISCLEWSERRYGLVIFLLEWYNAPRPQPQVLFALWHVPIDNTLCWSCSSKIQRFGFMLALVVNVDDVFKVKDYTVFNLARVVVAVGDMALACLRVRSDVEFQMQHAARLPVYCTFGSDRKWRFVEFGSCFVA